MVNNVRLVFAEQVGGAVMQLDVRAQLDAVLAHHASTSAKGLETQSRAGVPASSVLLCLQYASLRALAASVLAPCSHRPPFLATALNLFRQVGFHCKVSPVARQHLLSYAKRS